MNNNQRIERKIISILLTLAMLLSYIPVLMIASGAEGTLTSSGVRVSDPSTMDGWREFFLPANGNLSTENAGGIWTNKSVFTDGKAFEGTGIKQSGMNSFLVALSAIASNMSVTGMSTVPTDTMLVLDVSGSMNDENNDVAEALAASANQSIKTLMETNSFNRVGVVLYSGPSVTGGSSGNDATLLLPLGRYTTSDSQGRFVNYSTTGGYASNSTERISLNSSVVYEGTARKPSEVSKTVVGGTYIQLGLSLAAEQFTAAGNETTVTDRVLGTINRKPILVLMSDGAPTLASTNYSKPVASNLGSGGSSSTAIGFTTQLTAAYLKAQIEAKYKGDALFFTLGLAVGNSTDGSGDTDDIIAASVLDPKNTSADIAEFWTRFKNLATGGSMVVQEELWGDVWYQDYRGRWYSEYEQIQTEEKVTKLGSLDGVYVDTYFPVNATSGTTLSEALKAAFAQIVDEIQLQSAYYPTLVSGSEDLSGYVSFVDKIGKYMTVTGIKGILVGGNTLFSGAELSSNFVSGGGLLGTTDKPEDLGNEMVFAVKERLGLKDTDEARTLITLAYNHGQLSYTDKDNFSNYIGWYANAAGEFLGFWHEGITTMPDPSDPTLTDKTRPVFIVKSYGYLGSVNNQLKSDMMYATVQVRERISDGEETVIFSIPASLIPTVTYEVSLDENGKLDGLEAHGATEPIRLVYETELDSSISEFTLGDIVSDEYLNANTNPDGSVNFYTNQFEADNATGYGKVNTYSYFTPSRENDRYYYQENVLVYTDTNGTLYSGTEKPSGEMYHAYRVYTKVGEKLEEITVYHRLTAETLDTAEKIGEAGPWYVSEGDVRRDYYGYTVEKSENITGTLTFSDAPYTDIEGHNVNDTSHAFVFGVTMGNNGKITVTPGTGLKITKHFSGTDGSGRDYTFTLESLGIPDGTYTAEKTLATGIKDASVKSVTFSGGVATVTLKANESLAFIGIPAGISVKVREEKGETFVQKSVIGLDADGSVTTGAGLIKEVIFTNATRGSGNLTVSKEVVHPFGANYSIPAKTFEVKVILTLDGVAYGGKDINGGAYRTDADGSITLSMKHGEQYTLLALPEGVVATVVEENPGVGFTAAYLENNILGDGIISVESGKTNSVLVVNTYSPKEVYPVNITVSGSKTLEGRDWTESDTFTFELQKHVSGDTWTVLGSAEVTGKSKDKLFKFEKAFENEKYTSAGVYYYRVAEVEPQQKPGGIAYDKTVHSFAVHVGDSDLDGSLEIVDIVVSRPDTTHLTTTETGWNVETDFTNRYSASGDTTVTVDITKTVENPTLSDKATLSGFTFGLYNESGVLVSTSAPTTERGFTRLVIDSLKTKGTYKFTLKEILPESIPAGWEYSKTEINLTVVVSDDGNGTLFAVIYKDSENFETATNATSATFVNKYNPKPAELSVNFVNKTLENKELIGNDFEFEIHSVDATTGSTAKYTDGTNDRNGKVNFNADLKFDKVGIYYFDIFEAGESGNGITKDSSVYRIMVTVSDGGNGTLVATYEIISIEGDEITFVNVYTASPAEYAISGTKTLVGKELINDEFTFTLEEATDFDGTLKQNGLKLEAMNTQSGVFTFPKLGFESAGTYFYVVGEKGASGATFGIIYDENKYVVQITVEDDGKGKLYVSDVECKLLGNGPVNAIAFKNEYKPNPASAAILAKKIMHGKDLVGEDFTFELYKSDKSGTVGEFVESVKNDKAGLIRFKDIAFDKAGDYYYILKEVKGDKGGVTYDKSEYIVKVEVTDNQRGELSAKVLYFTAALTPITEVEFVNGYSVGGSASLALGGEKTLEGRTLVDGEFTFELYKTGEDFAIDIGQTPFLTASNASGKYSLKLDYTSEDVGETYYYILREKNAGFTVDGVTFSNVEYKVKVRLLDNGDGTVKLEYEILKGSESVKSNELDFVNTYSAKDAKLTLSGKKILLGRPLANGEFKFVLRETSEKFEALEGKNPVNALNGDGGVFTFSELVFGEVGTYYFVIEEDASDASEGVTYDKTKYYVTVYVTDGNDGELLIEYTVKTDPNLESTVEEIKFENVYTELPPPGTIDPPATGDSETVMWIMMFAISGIGLLAVLLNDKKRKIRQ